MPSPPSSPPIPGAPSNRDLARLLRETADLLEIAQESPTDAFRVRGYRLAADAVETCAEPVSALAADPARLRALPGVGKKIAENLAEVVATGRLGLREELLERFHPGMLELLQIQGLGPKTIALIWAAHRAGTVDAVEALAREGRLRELPRLGEKAEAKILRSIATHRALSGRHLRSTAAREVERIVGALAPLASVRSLTPAGSFRRGRETVGDLDFVVAGEGFGQGGEAEASEAFLALAGTDEVLGRGPTKLSARRVGGLQVDLRFVPPASAGAALQYFTGSQAHNIALRQRALQRGWKLNEYGLFDAAGLALAGADEEEIYQRLGLAWIPPELREDAGEFEAAAGAPPALLAAADLRGDVHMHTTESDGRASIEEMAAAAAARGYEYLAITEHSQALAMARGLDERRVLAHGERIRGADRAARERDPAAPRILAGIEVDILADGRLDLRDEALAPLDVVIASVHSRFDQPPEQMTERLLRALENPYVRILGHPSGRILLRREPYAFDFAAVLAACARLGVALEINAAPERLDLNDIHARACGRAGVPVVINTDAHRPEHLAHIVHGVAVARRAWLGPANVLNTLPAAAFLARLRPKPA